MLKLLKN